MRNFRKLIAELLEEAGLVGLSRKRHPGAEALLSAYRSLGLDPSITYAHLYDYSTTHFLSRILLSGRINAVIDVGANVGQFAKKVRQCGYAGKILSFEPNPECFSELQEVSRRDESWDIFPFALGASQTSLELNVFKDNSFSSFRSTTSEAHALFHELVEKTRTVSVAVKPLDAVMAENYLNLDRLFLKVDTQGFELPVLQGAPSTLAKCSAVMLETPGTKLYEQTSSADELDAYLSASGFGLAHRIPLSFDTHTMLPIECDSYYLMRGEAIG